MYYYFLILAVTLEPGEGWADGRADGPRTIWRAGGWAGGRIGGRASE